MLNILSSSEKAFIPWGARCIVTERHKSQHPQRKGGKRNLIKEKSPDHRIGSPRNPFILKSWSFSTGHSLPTSSSSPTSSTGLHIGTEFVYTTQSQYWSSSRDWTDFTQEKGNFHPTNRIPNSVIGSLQIIICKGTALFWQQRKGHETALLRPFTMR